MIYLLVYRQFFPCAAGTICAALFAFSSLPTTAQIALPDPPSAAPPPAPPRKAATPEDKVDSSTPDADQKAQKAEKAAQARVEEREQQKKAAELQELQKPQPLVGFVELSLLYPIVAASGERQEYKSDFATHFNSWFRVNSDKPSEEVSLWAGLRLAPFSGTGIQNNERGRFATTYFGPAIGFGKISAQEAFAPSEIPPARSGWLVGLGVAAVSKLEDRRIDHAPVESDFVSQPYGLDPPGAWGELRYFRTMHSVLSTNMLLGGQLGEGKAFYYLGVGLGGWI